jgi:NADH-quinone oxidoreductase subunit M
VISAASMGLPGFSGFIAELMVLLGTWGSFPWLLIPAGLGVVLTAAFTLKALQKSFFPRTEGPRSSLPVYPASTWPERIGAGVLILVAVAVGLFPQMLLDLILSSFHSDLMRVLFP